MSDIQYVLLEQWQAVELFCRLVTKFEAEQGRTLEQFSNNDFLLKKLNQYGTTDDKQQMPLSRAMAKAIFGMKKDLMRKDATVVARPKEIYKLSHHIRYNEPVVLKKEDVWDRMLEYIDDPNYDYGRVMELERWKPNDKQRLWEGQAWWIYFCDVQDTTHGVTRALLKFGSFGKAEINGYRTDTGRPEDYTGWFKIHSTNQGKNIGRSDGGDTITLRMKLKETREKDLHIRIYIGMGDVSLALGQYNNSGSKSFYTGSLMMQPIPKDLPEPERVPKFFAISKGAINKEIPKCVYLYFLERQRNIQRIPKLVKSETDFNIWHRSKNPELYQNPPWEVSQTKQPAIKRNTATKKARRR